MISDDCDIAEVKREIATYCALQEFWNAVIDAFQTAHEIACDMASWILDDMDIPLDEEELEVYGPEAWVDIQVSDRRSLMGIYFEISGNVFADLIDAAGHKIYGDDYDLDTTLMSVPDDWRDNLRGAQRKVKGLFRKPIEIL